MDDDIFAQFDFGSGPPPMNPSDGEPQPNGRKRGRKATKVARLAPAKAGGKRGRPKKEQLYMAKGTAIEPIKAVPTKVAQRKPRKVRETKISLTAAADAFAGLTNADVAFVTAAIRNMSDMSAKQKQRIVHTLTRLFA